MPAAVLAIKVHFFGLLLDVWDRGLLPGVFEDYPQDYTGARHMINALHTKMMDQSWELFGAFFAISTILGLAGILGRLRITPDQIVARGLIVAVMLTSYNSIFGTIMATGGDVAYTITSREELIRAAQQIQKATSEISVDGAAQESESPGVFKLFGQILFALTGGLSLVAVVVGLSVIIMLIGSLFINTIWIIFSIVLYVFGPIIIVLGLIPGWGPKLLTNWLGAVIQLAAWQIWLAICWWIIQVSSALPFFTNKGEMPTIDNIRGNVTSFEGAAFALAFALLYLATPFIIQGLLPLGRFSVMAGIGMAAAQSQVSGAVKSVSGGAQSAAKSGQGGGEGSSRSVGTSYGGGRSGAEGGAAAGGGGGGGAAAGGGAAGGGAAAGGAAATGAGAAVAAPIVAAQAGVAAVQKVNDGIKGQAQDMGNA